MAAPHDPKSVAGKSLPVQESCQLLVIGAGPAGIGAAAHAARLGLKVVLADENPVPATVMGDDIPLHFGQRFSAAARNRTAMLESFSAREPAIAELFDAGVDVRLGTSVWGLYANGPSVGWLPGPVAGLHDHDGNCVHAWLRARDRGGRPARHGARFSGLGSPWRAGHHRRAAFVRAFRHPGCAARGRAWHVG